MPSQVLALSIFKEFSLPTLPPHDTLQGLCKLSRAFVSYWGEEHG